jgi:hypothetical protein
VGAEALPPQRESFLILATQKELPPTRPTDITTQEERVVTMTGKSETAETEEAASSADELKTGIFQQFFSPGTAETSGSESNDEGSAGSETRLSTLSASTGSMDSSDGEHGHGHRRQSRKPSKNSYKFDVELRARHRGACKNMTVRCLDKFHFSFFFALQNLD